MARKPRAAKGSGQESPPENPGTDENAAGTGVMIAPKPASKEKRAEKESKAEKVPEPQDLVVPAALLLAADAVSSHAKTESRTWLMGVHLRSQDKKAIAEGSDGARVFMGSFAIDGAKPEWLKDGVILSNQNIKAIVGMIVKASFEPLVKVRWAKGLPKVELSDIAGNMLFRVDVVDGTFPDTNRVIPASAFQNLDDDGNPVGKEWEPIGINSRYLKHVGDIAAVLEKGLEKDQRSENGMIVRAHAGANPDDPMVFDFNTWPGAILIMAAAKTAREASPETAALLAPAVKLTVAALRAHATRNLEWAEEATNEFDKARFTAKAEGFQARVAEILKRAPGLTSIAAEPQRDAAE